MSRLTDQLDMTLTLLMGLKNSKLISELLRPVCLIAYSIKPFCFRLVSFNVSHRSAARTGGLSEDDSDFDLSVGRRKGRRSKNTSKVKGYDGNDVYNDIDIDESSAPKISTDFTTDGEESSNQSAEIIAETKYRLKSLEKEAQVSKYIYLDWLMAISRTL